MGRLAKSITEGKRPFQQSPFIWPRRVYPIKTRSFIARQKSRLVPQFTHLGIFQVQTNYCSVNSVICLPQTNLCCSLLIFLGQINCTAELASGKIAKRIRISLMENFLTGENILCILFCTIIIMFIISHNCNYFLHVLLLLLYPFPMASSVRQSVIILAESQDFLLLLNLWIFRI